ncbi:hypothetical protein D9758_010290 [Tetrapyrgos nigripes]|uniref:Uncharacterized protein n=1 Tax=Tetrapyrgos nigripes TaxID=182062 RepID=A0A8H5LL62_9AGAR|nr:hypothetical protein D9758_010290 [Tetrapyrgos nigripes]
MRFSTILVILAVASGALADLHNTAWCVNRKAKIAKRGGVVYSYYYADDHTKQACGAYRGRNTGSKQWDQCLDCTEGHDGRGAVCKSGAKHIGGDEMDHYCKQAGAFGSQPTKLLRGETVLCTLINLMLRS